jgi:hypothetical protein
VRNDTTLRRIKALAIPPAWSDVWICPDPAGHLQATGRDVKGRKQYRYHAQAPRRDATWAWVRLGNPNVYWSGNERTPVPDDAKRTRPSDTTREAEAADAQVHATPDHMPTPEEEQAAERAPAESPEVAENYEEAMERGARQKGEGRLP